MKIKTSELSGMALCYAVCMIEIPHLVWGKTIGKHHASDQIVVPELPEDNCYGPFASWRMFGPIIERERLTVWYDEEVKRWKAATCDWMNLPIESPEFEALPFPYDGPTPLIAAMRCYCCTNLGDEIEIPEELINLRPE